MRSWKSLFVLPLVTVAVSPAAAEAARLKVTVVQSVSQVPRPVIAGATVCYATGTTPSTPLQTDASGSAEFPQVPSGTIKVIAMKPGFVSKMADVLITTSDRQYVIALAPGQDTTGLRCGYSLPAPSQPIATTTARIQIRSFAINGGAAQTTSQTVTLAATFDRRPDVYRVGETPNLSAVPWRPLSPRLPLSYTLSNRGLDNFGSRSLYLQVAPGDGGASASAIAQDSIVVAPAALKSYTITGNDLRELIRRASTDWGFSSSGRITMATSRYCESKTRGIVADLPGIELAHHIVYTSVAPQSFTVYEGTLLAGRSLKPFWRIVQFEARPGGGSEEGRAEISVRGAADGTPRQLVRFAYTTPSLAGGASGGLPTSGLLCWQIQGLFTRVVVEGPDGFGWRDAFAR